MHCCSQLVCNENLPSWGHQLLCSILRTLYECHHQGFLSMLYSASVNSRVCPTLRVVSGLIKPTFLCFSFCLGTFCLVQVCACKTLAMWMCCLQSFN